MPRATAVSCTEQWSDWSSGRHLLARVRADGCWSDGLPLGRGHGQPYLQPAYARAVRDLRKSVEGRPLEGWVVHVAAGDWITFKISSSGGQQLVCRVLGVRHFQSFEEMVRACGVGDCLPLRPLSRSTTLSAIAKAPRMLSWHKLRAWLVFRSNPSTSLRRTCWRCRELRAGAPLLRFLPLPPKHGRRRRLGPGDAGVLASCLRRPVTSVSMRRASGWPRRHAALALRAASSARKKSSASKTVSCLRAVAGMSFAAFSC